MSQTKQVAETTETKNAEQAKVNKLIEANNKKQLKVFEAYKKASKASEEPLPLELEYIMNNGKKFKLGKGQSEIWGTILMLTAKEDSKGITAHEAQRLINAEDKFEVRSLSNVYSRLKKLSAKRKTQLLGKSTLFPSKFGDFAKLMPQKPHFSMWECANILRTNLNTKK